MDTFVTARFVGQSSMGYKHGECYNLCVEVRQRGQGQVTIRRSDGSGFCPYESIEAFEKNWEPTGETQQFLKVLIWNKKSYSTSLITL